MIARARHRRLCVLGQNKSMATTCRCRRAHPDNSSTLSHDPNQATSYSSSRRVLPETSRLHPVRLAPGYLHSLVWSRLTFCLAASGFTCPLLLSRVPWPKVSTGVLEDAQYTCEPQRCVYQVLLCENLAVGGFFGNFLSGVGGRFQVSLYVSPSGQALQLAKKHRGNRSRWRERDRAVSEARVFRPVLVILRRL